MIHALSGTNTFLLRQRLKSLRQDFIKKYGREGIEEYNGEALEPADLPRILASSSLFASNRLLIFKFLSQNKPVAEKFTELIEAVADKTDIVLVENELDKRTGYYKTLKKLDGFEEFSELGEPALKKWIDEKAKEQAAVIDQAAVKTLLDYVGSDQERLYHEIKKLAAYDTRITAEHVRELVEPVASESIFMLLDAIVAGQYKKALALLDDFEKNHADPFQLANMLIWQVHVLAVVYSAGEKPHATLAKEAKINPYVVQKTRVLAKTTSKRQLHTIIDCTATLDTSLKSQASDPWRLLEQMIITIS